MQFFDLLYDHLETMGMISVANFHLHLITNFMTYKIITKLF